MATAKEKHYRKKMHVKDIQYMHSGVFNFFNLGCFEHLCINLEDN